MFDFNASLNDAAPVSPMSLSVDLKKNEKGGLLMMPLVRCFFCNHHSDRAQ